MSETDIIGDVRRPGSTVWAARPRGFRLCMCETARRGPCWSRRTQSSTRVRGAGSRFRGSGCARCASRATGRACATAPVPASARTGPATSSCLRTRSSRVRVGKPHPRLAVKRRCSARTWPRLEIHVGIKRCSDQCTHGSGVACMYYKRSVDVAYGRGTRAYEAAPPWLGRCNWLSLLSSVCLHTTMPNGMRTQMMEP
eukprot:2938273-Rhodomonas_salina.2